MTLGMYSMGINLELFVMKLPQDSMYLTALIAS